MQPIGHSPTTSVASNSPETFKPESGDGFPYACRKCGKEMIFNVPRMGPAGGFVHKETSSILCEGQNIHTPIICKDESGDGFEEPKLLADEFQKYWTKIGSMRMLNKPRYELAELDFYAGQCAALASLQPEIHRLKEAGDNLFKGGNKYRMEARSLRTQNTTLRAALEEVQKIRGNDSLTMMIETKRIVRAALNETKEKE